MRLSLYFFRQYLPSFLFGWVLFSFVFLLDRLFDLIDLILNKGVPFLMILKLLGLFIPTSFPLAIPMAILLGCMVTFGRLSEENELNAVRAAGISLMKVLWIFPAFSLFLSLCLLPFNKAMAPWISREFRTLYQQIIHADPLINIVPKKFFAIKNIKIYAQNVDKEKKQLQNVFVFQKSQGPNPSERIFARSGTIESDEKTFKLHLKAGQIQRYHAERPSHLIHTSFRDYEISIPLKIKKDFNSTRYRNISSHKLKKFIKENQAKGIKTSPMEAENSLRIALSFAPLSFVFIGIPFATSLRKGSRAFNIGLSLMVIFAYYLLLIFGLTMAEKDIIPSDLSLWLANIFCFLIGGILIRRMMKK